MSYYWRASDIPGWSRLSRAERSHLLMAARGAAWTRGRVWAGILVFAVGAALALGNIVDPASGLWIVILLGILMVGNMAAVVQAELIARIPEDGKAKRETGRSL